MNRWDIINKLIKKYNYKTYLEIGYYKGWSFDQVECPLKIAVDPNPCKDEYQESMPDGGGNIKSLNGKLNYIILGLNKFLSKLPSDVYFSLIDEDEKYDIIFIDGLHESGQVERDIENAVKHLNEDGTIVLHDCNPTLEGHTTTGIDGAWTGDVYKAFINFRLNHSDYNSFVIDTDWGCGIIRKHPPLTFSALFQSEYKEPIEELIRDWNYFSKNRKVLLNLKSVEEGVELL